MLQKGFTLIELMIVVAIIGILSMFALPAYQDYTKRTYVAEGISLANSSKAAMLEYYTTNGRWPQSSAEMGLSDNIIGQAINKIVFLSGETIGTLDPDDPPLGKDATYKGETIQQGGSVMIYFNSRVMDESVLSMSAFMGGENDTSAGSLLWLCVSTTLPNKWLPSNCREQIGSIGGNYYDPMWAGQPTM